MNNTLFQGLQQTLQAGQSVAWILVVETHGPTPFKAGATMLVAGDGSQIGTLGGGHQETDIRDRALGVLGEGQTELLAFQIVDHDGRTDGGRDGRHMTLLIDPIYPGSDITYLIQLQQSVSEGVPCTEAIVIDSEKMSGTRSGDRYLLSESGALLSSRANLPLSDLVIAHLRDVKTRPRPYSEYGISYLPYLERCRRNDW